jgi:hypothetical protein
MARALDGQVETSTRPDGSTTSRHRYDNRTALALLARLDRMVEQQPADPAAAADAHAARLVAQDWQAFLELLDRDRGPADAGLFLARRSGLAGSAKSVPELGPVLALARADRLVHAGAALPQEVETADLRLAERADWTAEQWLRAEAAGLLSVAPVIDANAAQTPPLPPLVADEHDDGKDDSAVRWDDDAREYRTHLPPRSGETPDFEVGTYGDDDYQRCLTNDEQALLDRHHALLLDRRAALEHAERETWFAALRIELELAEQERDATQAALTDLSPPAPDVLVVE